MYDVQDNVRFTRAVNTSHQIRCWVELWSNGSRLSSNVPYIDGEVSDTWVVAGIRRQLSLSVPPTDQWLDWLALPSLELRPYRGIRFSPTRTMDCPLGRYPILPPEISRPYKAISIDADDYYQRVVEADYPYPIKTKRDTAVNAIKAQLSDQDKRPFAGWQPVYTRTGNIQQTPSIWTDKSRAETIKGWAQSHSLEVYIDRTGIPIITDVANLGAADTSLLIGHSGVESVAVKPDWDRVFNTIAVSSSVSGVSFPPVVASITDRNHPASPTRIGVRVRKYKSSTLLNVADARKAAPRLLQKIAGRAQTYSYTCVPDPRRDAGDSIRCPLIQGSTVAQIASVTHPLRASGKQTITTISTQAIVEDS